MHEISILLTVLFAAHCLSKGRYQELPLIDTQSCARVVCDPDYKYRTIDGSCTNLDIPYAARAGGPYTRFAPATFADGKSELRRSVRGGPLPNVRQIVNTLFPDRDVPDYVNTINVMQFGEVITEDMGHKMDRVLANGEDYNCCTEDFKMPPIQEMPGDCMPIEVPPSDPFYSQYNVRCITFTQAINNNNDSCWKYPVEKANFASSTLNAGQVYGDSEDIATALRTFCGGKLRVQYSEEGHEFPRETDSWLRDCDPALAPSGERKCFMTGDNRGNVNTELTLYHVIFLRLHNMLCDRLSELNPHWSDETLYQEARRIIGAVEQHVTYKHYLPILLGEEFVRKKGLLIDNCYDCCINYHDPKYNPSLVTEFGNAFRMFHSMCPREMFFVTDEFALYRIANIDDEMFRPGLLMESGNVDGLLRGLVVQHSQTQDPFFSTGIRDHLFKRDKPHGRDLVSMDVLRGREFGVATYNQMRHLCGLSRARTFADLADVMTPLSIKKLSSMYYDVDDIDLYVGVTFEELLPGTLVGPIAQCIVGEQFFLLMRGDRFYYENCGLPWSFTKEQIAAISQTSLSWVFCEAGDSLQHVSANSFLHISPDVNPVVSCCNIPGLDLSAWQEQDQDCR